MVSLPRHFVPNPVLLHSTRRGVKRPESLFLHTRYDAWDRLVQVSSGGTVVAQYQYDGADRLVAETAGGTTTYSFYAGQSVIETRVGGTAASNVQYQYVWSLRGDAIPILRDTYSGGQLQSASRIYYTTDANGSVTALIGLSGGTWVVIERYVYDAYGTVTYYAPNWLSSSTNPQSTINAPQNTLLYAGLSLDPLTGLQHADYRWYNSALATWTADDPIGALGSGANLYGYCGDGPMDAIDPSGCFWEQLLQSVAEVGNAGTNLLYGTENALRWGANGVIATANELGNMSNLNRPFLPYIPYASVPDWSRGIDPNEPLGVHRGAVASAEFGLGLLGGEVLGELAAGTAASEGATGAAASETGAAASETGAAASETGAAASETGAAACEGATARAANAARAGRVARSCPSRAPKKVPTPTLKSAGKIADAVPRSVPKNWSRADIEEAITDYQRSIKIRRAEAVDFEKTGGGDFWRRKDHYERIVEEENFLRQLMRTLEDMR
jgi:RHS repeat-associated protein